MAEASLQIDTPDGRMAVFLATPDGATAPAPAMVVLQEAYGVNAHIKEVCRRLAREGFVALAPELYHRFGDGLAFDYTEGPHAVAELAKLDNAAIETDVRAALAAARARVEVDARRVGVIGFCMGGFSAFLAACRTDVKTAVCFYAGGLVNVRPMFKLRPLVDEIDHVSAPVLLFFGEADAAIPPADVERVRAELKGRGKVHEIVVYPSAGHGFFCEDRASYDAPAATDAWAMTLGWLRQRL